MSVSFMSHSFMSSSLVFFFFLNTDLTVVGFIKR